MPVESDLRRWAARGEGPLGLELELFRFLESPFRESEEALCVDKSRIGKGDGLLFPGVTDESAASGRLPLPSPDPPLSDPPEAPALSLDAEDDFFREGALCLEAGDFKLKS